MKQFLTIALLLTSLTLSAQEYSFSFSQTPMRTALETLENEFQNQFYFAPEWVDSLVVDGTFTGNTPEEIYKSLFKGTLLDFAVLDKQVILTYNTPIYYGIRQEKEQATDPEETVTYVYTREYVDKQASEEEQTYEIGEKAQLPTGGRANLAGFVRDKETGEPVSGAAVYIPNTSSATITDGNGFYSLSLTRGLNILHIQFMGMVPTKRRILLYSSGSLNINMVPDVIMLEDVTFEADRDANIDDVRMGLNTLNIEEMRNVPKILGENDIVQVALALPGVQSVGEGAGGINVRGGKVDQNLMLLNGATIYNPFHFFGFFSSFNADVIGDAELYKSSIPAEFGGRLSSVFDVSLKDDQPEKVLVQGGISPVTSRLSIEVPVSKTTSLISGVRATYSDWVLNFVDEETIKESDPWFIDGVVGFRNTVENRTLGGMAYYSRDRFKLTTDSLYSYENIAASLDGRFGFENGGGFDALVSFSRYRFNVDYETFPETAFNYFFQITDFQSKLGTTIAPKILNHDIYAGIEGNYTEVLPGNKSRATTESLIDTLALPLQKGVDLDLFISDDWKISERLTLSLGLRLNYFRYTQEEDEYLYEPGLPKSQNTVIDTLSAGDPTSYFGPEYRISGRYSLTSTSSIKFGLNRTRQNIHILSNNISVAPTNTWTLSNRHIQPQVMDQFSLGYFKNFDNGLEASIEGYYKKFQNLLEYKNGADLLLNPLIETDILQGDGYAYGVELLLRKRKGRLNGWVGYTYSRSLQRFGTPFAEETINDGDFFPTNYDQPHEVTMVTNYKLTRRFSFSFNLKYSTGRPITYPVGLFNIANTQVVQYSDRNTFRIPDYFRIDLGVNIDGNHKKDKPAHGFWTISVYNLLGRDNVYSIFFVPENGTIQGYELSVFASPIPTITYNFKF